MLSSPLLDEILSDVPGVSRVCGSVDTTGEENDNVEVPTRLEAVDVLLFSLIIKLSEEARVPAGVVRMD